MAYQNHRCVQESFCKAENVDPCGSEEYYNDSDEEVVANERNDYDDYYSSNVGENGCSCQPPSSILTLFQTQGWGEQFVCCNNVVSGGPPTCEEGFK